MNFSTAILAFVFLAAFYAAEPLFAQSSLSSGSEAQPGDTLEENLLSLPDGEGPVHVHAAFRLLGIHRIDDDAETFTFSALLTLTWKDRRQAFDPLIEGVNEKFYNGGYQFNELSPAWYPQVILANAIEIPDPQGVILRVKPDGTSILVQPITAVARCWLDLRKYPFDRQCLEAVFEVLGFDETEVLLTAEAGTGATIMDPSRILVPQWDLTKITATSEVVSVAGEGDTARSPVVVLSLDVDRRSFFMVRLVIFPLVVIVMLSWSVFWMDRSSLGDRMSVSFVGILTAVAYQLMVSEIMPHISYITLMNVILHFSFAIMCATVLVNLRVGALEKRGDMKEGERLDYRSRVVFPLVYVGLTVVTIAWFWK